MSHAARTSPREASDATTRLAILSPREREVAASVAEGLTNAEIGARLHLSASSIKAMISTVLTRLDLTNRTQLAVLAHEADRC